MARLSLSSDRSSFANCDILNETYDQYVVKFANGAVSMVDKDRVYALNEMDNEVLDTVRRGVGNFVNKAADYGRRFVKSAGEFVGALKRFFVKAFNIDGVTILTDENGKVLPVSLPCNTCELAKKSNSINFYPNDIDISNMEKMGKQAQAVETFSFEDNDENNGEYQGSIDFLLSEYGISESFSGSNKKNKSLIDFLNEDSITTSGKYNTEDFDINIVDWDLQEIKDHLAAEYKDRCRGQSHASGPLLIFGAPGVGKTSIIRGFAKEVGATVICINGATVGPEDFTLPVRTDKVANTIAQKMDVNSDEFKQTLKNLGTSSLDYEFDADANKKGFVEFPENDTNEYVKDVPKNWLPVYDISEFRNERGTYKEALCNAAANNGELIDKEGQGRKRKDGTFYYQDDGKGGFFFIDEYLRMSQAAMNTLMDVPVGRTIGKNLQFGSKWVIVAASNRPSDMKKAYTDNIFSANFESAQKTRWTIANYVPDPKDWIEWARKVNKMAFEDEADENGNIDHPNIISDIVNFVEDSVNQSGTSNGDDKKNGWYYKVNLGNNSGGNNISINTKYANATPRSWENLSGNLVNAVITLHPDDYESLSTSQKFNPSLLDFPNDMILKQAESTVGLEAGEHLLAYALTKASFTLNDVSTLINGNIYDIGNNGRSSYNLEERLKITEEKFPHLFKYIFNGDPTTGRNPQVNQLNQYGTFLDKTIIPTIHTALSVNTDLKEFIDKAKESAYLKVYYFLESIHYAIALKYENTMNDEEKKNYNTEIVKSFYNLFNVSKFEGLYPNINQELMDYGKRLTTQNNRSNNRNV